MKTASLALLLAFQTLSLSAARPQAGAKHIDIRTLSTRADRVSGGDVLVEIVAPGGTARAVPHDITLNGRDVSPASHAAPGSGSLVGRVTNRAVGKNVRKGAG